jgi:hypothetical protein
MTDNYARSFFTQRSYAGLNVREGLLGNASTEVVISAEDMSRHTVDGLVKVLAFRTELTSRSRPYVNVFVFCAAPLQ